MRPTGSRAIFPPGYALLLAPAFLVGAPMLVGPLLAAALVVATWLLAREIALASGDREEQSEKIARVAVGLSILSAALRYHTADALPYGATAVAVAMALATSMCARRTGEARLFGVAGLAVGFLRRDAARLGDHDGRRRGGARLRGARAAVARSRGACSRRCRACCSSPRRTMRRSGGSSPRPWPPTARPSRPTRPSSVRSAATATLRRLRAHLLDVDNFEPLTLLALVAIVRGGRGARLGAIVVAGQILLAAPFDAASVSPGAGAKLLVSVIPVEHALIALALARLFPVALPRAAVGAFALALAGFAVHASNDHEKLAASDLGRPRFEPDVAREANVTHGLLFFDDDAGFKLAFDPGVPASHGIQAVRMRNDDHDRLLYDSLGHPAIAPVRGDGQQRVGDVLDAARRRQRYVAVRGRERLAPGRGVGRSSPRVIESPGPVRVGVARPRADAGARRRGGDRHDRASGPPRTDPGRAEDLAGHPAGVRARDRRLGNARRRAFARRPTARDLDVGRHRRRSPTCPELPAQPVELGGDRPRAWLVLHARGGAVALDKTSLRAH